MKQPPNNGNASKAGAASAAVNIGRGNPGSPLSARSGDGVGMAPNGLVAGTAGQTKNSAKGLPYSVPMSKASATGGRVAKMPAGYKKGS